MSTVDPATGLEVLIKQPFESREYDLDFSNLLEEDEYLKTIISVTSTNLGKQSGSTNVTIVGYSITSDKKKVRMRIEGGTNGEDYKITAQVDTYYNNRLEGEGLLRVKDY